MHKLFTRLGLLTVVFALGACSSVSVPLLGGKDSASSPTVATNPDDTDVLSPTDIEPGEAIEGISADDYFGPAKVVPTPRLKSGSLALFERALTLLQEGKVDAAEVLLEELTQDQPELAGPWVNLAKIHLSRNDVDAATTALDMAIVANPSNCDALTQMGVLARKQGRFADAESLYQSCIQAQPNYANAYLNLGILYELYMGQLSQALAAYNDYQIALPKPDQQVAGWVIDLERRVASIAKR